MKNEKIINLIVTFFGAGRSPKAPGTVGTLAALPLVIFLTQAGPLIYMGIVVLLAIVGMWASEQYEQLKGGHDHQEIVIDEVVGILITMTWIPLTWQSVLAGFILFRVLDIFKPFPIGTLDKKVPGGMGVMADDMAAGIIANIILQVILVKTSWLGVQLVY